MSLNYHLPVIYGGSLAPGSLAIQGFTGSAVSHVGILLPRDGGVLESVGGKGVSIASMSDFTRRYSRVMVGDYPSFYTPEDAIERALSKRGQQYDYPAIFGILTRTGWNHDGKWICSELLAWATGTVTGNVARYTQQDALIITRNLKRIK
jgi:hypothetical protein